MFTVAEERVALRPSAGSHGSYASVQTEQTTTIVDPDEDPRVKFAIKISLVVNLLLLASKIAVSLVTGSMSILAATADSLIDIFAQLVLMLGDAFMNEQDTAKYPAGKTKLGSLSVLACAALMGIASFAVIGVSISRLYEGLHNGDIQLVVVDWPTAGGMVAVIVSKTWLWLYCRKLRHVSETVMALAEDHRNDVVSNMMAVATAVVSTLHSSIWCIDPLGAIAISVYIIANWCDIAATQVNYIIGRTAPPELYQQIADLSKEVLLNAQGFADIVRAYHFGSNFMVEVEIVLPATMNVRESHDLALTLQMGIERLEVVERAFVHVDYEARLVDEHDWRFLQKHGRFNSTPHSLTALKSRSRQSSFSSLAVNIRGL